MKKISILLVTAVILSSCVSKKKYLALEQQQGETLSELTKTRVEKEDLENKFAVIEARVNQYNSKIQSLNEDVEGLTIENKAKFQVSEDGTVASGASKEKMRETLKNVSPEKLAGAKTLKDSMNIAIQYNLSKAMNTSDLDEDEDIVVDINETVVMISIADNMLFNTASYRVGNKADKILQKLADVINSEPSLDVMVEGHTDARSINTDKIADNWDLSVLRATSVVRKLQNQFKVAPDQLIASGRSSYQPLVENDNNANRAKNRRTRIILMPNIDKFFAMMEEK
ncbi:Flagellar motor rotation protein MotB [Winogradskyella psychrotolerans RS-3]|uniref:Flagellar motor rotation protein MotB n=1 Tax=Winogradskyella psychrotolerans RS-3 TaxID=641526 RepID=S7VJC7_9FLAO|nr:OmpA family protein [Winogradskyella psychrotolerans]EPR70081.1 Flagellar motor rotation protein MotB [Winogradskyella psychrotolerans RS-3]